MAIGVYGHVGSLLGQRRHPQRASSVVGPSAGSPWPVSVSCAAYLSRRHSFVRTSRFRLVLRLSGLRCGVDLEAPVVSQVPRTPARARVVGPRRGRSISRMRNTQWVRGPRPLFAPKQAFYASCERRPFPFWPSPLGAGHAGDGVGEECYLVDPASSHMLVSKIKPCMCKYELIQTVKLRMAH